MCCDIYIFKNILNKLLSFPLNQVKRIFCSHFVDQFYLHVAGDFMFLLFGEGKVHVYAEKIDEWSCLPDFNHNLSNSAICIMEQKEEDDENESW